MPKTNINKLGVTPVSTVSRLTGVFLQFKAVLQVNVMYTKH